MFGFIQLQFRGGHALGVSRVRGEIGFLSQDAGGRSDGRVVDERGKGIGGPRRPL